MVLRASWFATPWNGEWCEEDRLLAYVEAVVRSDLSRALDKLDLNVLLPMPETPGLQQAGRGSSSSCNLKHGEAPEP